MTDAFHVPLPRALAVFGLIAAVSVFWFQQQRAEHDLISVSGTVLYNWRDHGYWNLGGRVVTNPGGIAPGETPEVYAGYRGFSLLPLHALHLLTGSLWWSLLIFFVLMSMGLAFVIWWCLGRTGTGLVAAIAFCWSPSFVREMVNWNPVPGTVLLGVPVIMVLLRALDPVKQPVKFATLVGFAAVTVLYAQIEWASIFALFIGWSALVVLLWPGQRVRLGILTVALGVGVLLGPVLLMRQKSVDGGGSGLSSLIASYFGQGGYGEGLMTWPLALKRLTVVGIIGVLPLWAVLAVIVWHLHVRKKSAVMVALAPLGAALFGCLAMRNPMAHHQWIACSVISLGILVSLQLLLRPVEMDISTAAAVRPATESRWFFILLAIACFGYGQVIGAVNQTNFANVNALVGLVQEHTPRSALICIGPDLEAQLSVEDAGPMLDRHVRSFGSCSEGGAMQRVFVVNSRPLPGWQSPVATARSRENPLLGRVLGWYTAHITKRKTLRLQLPKNYLLYEMLPRTQLLPPSATRSIVTPDGPSAIAS